MEKGVKSIQYLTSCDELPCHQPVKKLLPEINEHNYRTAVVAVFIDNNFEGVHCTIGRDTYPICTLSRDVYSLKQQFEALRGNLRDVESRASDGKRFT